MTKCLISRSFIVLSKLRHFARSDSSDLESLRALVDVRPALHMLGAPDASFVAVSGGTLGVGFIAPVDGRKRFLKSYASASSKADLEKEIRILSHLYGEMLAIQRLEVAESAASSRVWLVMDALNPRDKPLTPDKVFALIRQFRSRLSSFSVESLETADTLGTLIDDAILRLSDLASAGEISQPMFDDLHARLAYLAREWQRFPTAVAHGDLGPRNIMVGEDNLVVIDWEDAFLGVEGYDYLYWLTFFENRSYYGKEILGQTSLGVDAEMALLVMILVLKSDLSRRANGLIGNLLTVEQRIGEVLALA